MARYFLGDTHFGHRNIANFRKRNNLDGTPMSSEEQHEAMFEGLAKIKKADTLWLMGDICFTSEWLQRMKELPCRNKIAVIGNHDITPKMLMRDYCEVFDKVYSVTTYKKHWMQHTPIHKQELRGRKMVHGHLHYALVLDMFEDIDRDYITTSAEYLDFEPKTWEYITSEEYAQECTKKHWEFTKLGYLNQYKGE